MSRCEQVQETLSALLDDGGGAGELPDATLEAHLRGCSDCRAFRDDATAIRRRLRVGPVGTVPDIAGAVDRRLASDPRPRGMRDPRPRGMPDRRLASDRRHDRRTPQLSRRAFRRTPRRTSRWVPRRRPRGRPQLPGRTSRRTPQLPRRRPRGMPQLPGGTSPTPQLSGRASRRRPQVLGVAAAFLAGVVLSATLLGVGRDGAPLAAASLPERILDAQHRVDTVQATVTVRERGWHPDVDERRFTGTLGYEAPESLALHLEDRTAYPGPEWEPGDIDVVVDGDTSWTRGLRSCPVSSLPACTPDEPRAHRVVGRAPFDPSAPVPLDLAVPVDSFRSAPAPRVVGQGEVGGREAVAVEVSAAQLAPLLDTFTLTGNLREVHPSDPVELWLDEQALVPLRLRVRAGEGDARARWAAARGHSELPGTTILAVDLDDVVLDAALPDDAIAPAPRGEHLRTDDGGFAEGVAVDDVPVPAQLPDGLEVHRSGVVRTDRGDIGVRSWSDGRGWVTVRASTSWDRERLLGGLGGGTRTVALAGGGTGYVDPAANTVAVHGADLDVAVSGSLDHDALVEIAGSLGVRGRPIPDDWAEAAVTEREDAIAALDGLQLPTGPALDGFSAPGFRVDEDVVTAVYSGPGARSFVLVQGPGERLAPPLDVDAASVEVAGTVGRWSPGRGELEWVDGGVVRSLRSSTLDARELVEIAGALEPA